MGRRRARSAPHAAGVVVDAAAFLLWVVELTPDVGEVAGEVVAAVKDLFDELVLRVDQVL